MKYELCECLVYHQNGVEHPRGHKASGCSFATTGGERCSECGHNNVNRNNGMCIEWIDRKQRRCGCKCVPAATEAEGEQYRHHKHCAAWTVSLEGEKQPCNCICTCTHPMGQHVRPGEDYWYEDCAVEGCPCLQFTATSTAAPAVDAPQLDDLYGVNGQVDDFLDDVIDIIQRQFTPQGMAGRARKLKEAIAAHDKEVARIAREINAECKAEPSTLTPSDRAREAACEIQQMYRSTNKSLGYEHYEPSIEAVEMVISVAFPPTEATAELTNIRDCDKCDLCEDHYK